LGVRSAPDTFGVTLTEALSVGEVPSSSRETLVHLSPTPRRPSAALGAPAAGTSWAARVEPVAHDRPIRVMSFNIHHGRGVDGRLDLARVAAEVRHSGADIVGLQEVDRHWSERSDLADQAADLARALHMHVAYGANLDLDPRNPGEPRRQYGNAILSDAPLREWRNTLLPRTGNSEQRGLLEALISVRRVPVRMFSTHLQHNSQPERIAQIAAIRRVIGACQESVVLTGDLNAHPGTPEIDTITEDLIDAWAEAGVGDGYTYPAEDPNARLDYVLHSNDVSTCTAAVHCTDASDHLPVTADLALPGHRLGADASVRPHHG
jgi:endonuclease/exonuclease/phosphatase family metal-dependent hydrolase